jgi:hypothetical protein
MVAEKLKCGDRVPAPFFTQKSMVFNDFQRPISTIFRDILKIINQIFHGF